MTSRLPEHIQYELERHYRAGRPFAFAGAAVGLTRLTAYRYYKRYADQGIPRAIQAKALKRKRKYCARPNWFNPQPYNGPAWIGAPITPQPRREGSKWIGKAVVDCYGQSDDAPR